MPRSCFGSIGNPIAMMAKDHDFAGNLMAEIRTLSRDYTPPEGACPTFRAFYSGLREFEQDLRRHMHLETIFCSRGPLSSRPLCHFSNLRITGGAAERNIM